MEQQTLNKYGKANYFEVAPGVWGMRIVFVNIYMIAAENGGWVLVDAGLMGFADRIRAMATALFGEGVPPSAIILTHGHFDHRGALPQLLQEWNVPVYVHPLEEPYLKGKSAYPPPDPLTGGGLMSYMSFIYPKAPVNLGKKINLLTKDGSVPFLPNWIYLHTPGHSPGHISLFRSTDRLLIAGDAFVTTHQESVLCVAMQKKVVSGPPKYFTNNWRSAADSVRLLRDMEPAIAATGHGKPMYGKELANGLNKLVNNFKKIAVPKYGRYVKEPAIADRKGVRYLPPRPAGPVVAAAMIGAFVISFLLSFKR